MGARDGDDRDLLSRPLRLAARLRGEDEAELEHLFREARVLVRLEDAVATVPDAWETFLFAVNQVLRFCPNVAVSVPAEARDLLDAGDELAARVHGLGHQVQIAGAGDAAAFNAVVNIGTKVVAGLPWVTVNSTGWVARVATADSGTDRVPWTAGVPNAIGALGAACLGAGRAFLYVVGKPLAMPLLEISLFTNEVAAAGALPPGPELPSEPVELEAFLVGCGAVANGWAYTVKRLPIVGRLEAIDRQALRIENTTLQMIFTTYYRYLPNLVRRDGSLLARWLAGPRRRAGRSEKVRPRGGTIRRPASDGRRRSIPLRPVAGTARGGR